MLLKSKGYTKSHIWLEVFNDLDGRQSAVILGVSRDATLSSHSPVVRGKDEKRAITMARAVGSYAA